MNINGNKLKNDIYKSGITTERLTKILDKSDAWLPQALRRNRIEEMAFQKLCIICDLDPTEYILEDKKADEVKPTDARNVNFEAHITKLNDLGAIQAETYKVLTDMRTAQGETLKMLTRICEELILQTQILIDNKAAIGQMEKSVKDKTEKIYNYLKYPNGHSLTAVK